MPSVILMERKFKEVVWLWNGRKEDVENATSAFVVVVKDIGPAIVTAPLRVPAVVLLRDHLEEGIPVPPDDDIDPDPDRAHVHLLASTGVIHRALAPVLVHDHLKSLKRIKHQDLLLAPLHPKRDLLDLLPRVLKPELHGLVQGRRRPRIQLLMKTKAKRTVQPQRIQWVILEVHFDDIVSSGSPILLLLVWNL